MKQVAAIELDIAKHAFQAHRGGRQPYVMPELPMSALLLPFPLRFHKDPCSVC